MDSPTSLDFDLALERAGDRWRAHVVDSPSGQADHLFDLPFMASELRDLYAQFAADPLTPHEPLSLSLQDFGKRLYSAVFADDVRSNFKSSRQIAKSQNLPLRLKLRLSQSADLQNLPWELLHDGTGFLALSTETPVVRFLESPQNIRPLSVTPPLRALVVMASPPEYEKLDLESEWHRLEEALMDVRGLFQLERLPQPTLAQLQGHLRQDQYHVLHFSGHGEFSSESGAPALVLQDETGGAQPVTGAQLGTLLADRQALRLVILNACEGARASTRNAFAGIAQALIAQSVPAVIANQFAMSDGAAQILARELYAALAAGQSVDTALTEARKALFANQYPAEWATPVLYARTTNTNLFDLSALTDAARSTLRASELTRLADEAFAQEDFASAIQYAQRVLKLDPNNAAARVIRARAQGQLEVATLYADGKKLHSAGKWREALDLFRRVQTLQFNYRDVVNLIGSATDALQAESAVAPPPSAPERVRTDPFETEYRSILKELFKGRLVPFFGQGVNLFGRAANGGWQREQSLPSGEELARHLAKNFDYDQPDASDLIRVSQFVSVMRGASELYDELHSIFGAPSYKPTPLHRFWAQLPARLRAHAIPNPYPILFTATYDDLLEQAFREADEPFDLLIYLAAGEERGKFLHRTYEGVENMVHNGNDYRNMQLDRRATIVRIQGAISRTDPERDSYVITEDHYLDYLQSDIATLLPYTITSRIKDAYVLFMGCNLRNWNLRGLLYRLARTKYRPWVVQPQALPVDVEYWRTMQVRILDLPLDEFLLKLSGRLDEATQGGAS